MKKLLSLVVALALAVMVVAPVSAYGNSVAYRGQGLIADGYGGYDLQTELCGVANGAAIDGPYLLWVLTATSAQNADISFFGAAPVAMTKFGNGTFKYVSGWYDPSTLPGHVVGTYDGKVKNVQLVISHGCRPYTHGAWCSPGFWRNATDAAWALTGYAKTDLFNSNVYDYWYGATFAASPTLLAVVNDPPTYSGAPFAGTSGYALNAFNATGAFLTNNIPGYQFDPSFMQSDDSQTCPIDHFGNFK